MKAKPAATILVVEDDADIRAAVVETLESSGYRVLAARDGPEALAAIDNDSSIDLMFSDVVMPHGVSGVELVHAAHQLRPQLRVLLTSGYSAQVLEGASDLPLIKKPYRISDLIRRIRNALGEGAA
ncbi:MAG TPA: response regulator [Stellaceae bacterium]|nr:response regulator [Stellaceae bacterium]